MLTNILNTLSGIEKKLAKAGRLSPEEGLFLLSEAPLTRLSELASSAKSRMWGRNVTFVQDTNPNYTNICECRCGFCAFFRNPGDADAFTLTVGEIIEKVGKAVKAGATTVLMQGGCNPDLPIEYYFDIVRALGKEFPEVHLHLFSPPEIMMMSEVGNIPFRDVLEKLRDLGLKSLPGGGAEILVGRVRRKVSPGKISAADWLKVMKEAHLLGFKTTATMVFGLGETDPDLISHLNSVRKLQDKTDGFTAFVPWSFKPGNSEIPDSIRARGPSPLRRPRSLKLPSSKLNSTGWEREMSNGVKYLRLLATARLFLDNFRHIQASWFSEGKRTGQLGLLFGADDFGGTLFEENVLKTAGHDVRSGVEEVKALIRGAGMVPVIRDTLYQKLEVCTK